MAEQRVPLIKKKLLLADTMHYLSTRGHAPKLNFEEAVLAGLAGDGGLYVPESLPYLEPPEIAALAGLPYPELAARIMTPFMGEMLDEAELLALLGACYVPFRHRAVAPLKQLGPNHWLMELFHGPTLAFKDFALQFLGRVLAHILATRGERVLVLGATSGDTGSAAIAGCSGLPHVDVAILYPHGRVSDIQRRQMTTVTDANVHCLAIDGDFDDCQRIVKALFLDRAFQERRRLVAVNSINWARILAQVVYYFHAALSLGAPAQAVRFSVPTGNFGDIYAGWIARQMGLPIADLIIASNRNDILTRCYHSGIYGMEGVTPSLSPSMDIQVSSNFERLLFDLHDRDSAATAALMESLRQNGSFMLSGRPLTRLREHFSAVMADDKTTLSVIRDVRQQTGEILDPHTAVGVYAANTATRAREWPVVTLATAHPAKFPDAVMQATGHRPALPAHLKSLGELPERYTRLAGDANAVKSHLASVIS